MQRTPAEFLAAEVVARLLRRQTAFGGEAPSCEPDFDGKWLFNDQVHRILGAGTDLKVGSASWFFRAQSSKKCELFVFDTVGTTLIHVVNGRLSADRQIVEWSNGRTWKRALQGEEDAQLQDFLKENHRLAEENRNLRNQLLS